MLIFFIFWWIFNYLPIFKSPIDLVFEYQISLQAKSITQDFKINIDTLYLYIFTRSQDAGWIAVGVSGPQLHRVKICVSDWVTGVSGAKDAIASWHFHIATLSAQCCHQHCSLFICQSPEDLKSISFHFLSITRRHTEGVARAPGREWDPSKVCIET